MRGCCSTVSRAWNAASNRAFVSPYWTCSRSADTVAKVVMVLEVVQVLAGLAVLLAYFALINTFPGVPRVSSCDAAGTCPVMNHSAWTTLLQTYTAVEPSTGLVTVDFASLRAASEFHDYLDTLHHANLTGLSEPGRKALFLNAFNALVLMKAGDTDPPSSLARQSTLVTTAWTPPVAVVGTLTLSLENIGVHYLRSVFKDDPRLAAALHTACVSSPVLYRKAFEEPTLDAQLNATTIAWLQDAVRGVELDQGSNTLTVSRLLQYFELTITPTLHPFLVEFLPSSTAQYVSDHADTIAVVYKDWDWSLNSMTTTSVAAAAAASAA